MRGVVAVDSPVGGENADDVEPMVPLGVTGNWGSGAAVVLDLDPDVVARTDNDSDGERPALQAEGWPERLPVWQSPRTWNFR